MSDEKTPNCSFCQLGQDDVAILVQGPGLWICNSCIELSQEILETQPGYHPISDGVVRIRLPGGETTIAELRRALSQHHFDTRVRVELT